MKNKVPIKHVQRLWGGSVPEATKASLPIEQDRHATKVSQK